MRERLTAATVVVVLVLLAAALAVRSYTLDGVVSARESDHLHARAELVRQLVEARQDRGLPVDEEFLSGVVGRDSRVRYAPAESTPVVVTGPGFEGDPREGLSASVGLEGGGLVTVGQSADVVQRLVAADPRSIVLLFTMVALLAGVLGYAIARAMSAPFQRLAGAAETLGRGRFEIDLPQTRIPEARAIAEALRSSAARLQERLARDQAFSEHASHVLRTPLTGLRLELEELTLRDDVPEDLRGVAHRGLGAVGQVDAAAGELVDLSRRGSLVEGAEIPLRDLAVQSAQRWADALAPADRTVTAAAEGALDVEYTPGPVEYVLDLLLEAVKHRGEGWVRLVFDGDARGHLRVRIACQQLDAVGGPGDQADPPVLKLRTVVEALGGRLRHDRSSGELEVLMPHR